MRLNSSFPEKDAQLARIGQWVIETCLLFGTRRKTAYLVAGAFVKGVEREWLTNEAEDGGADSAPEGSLGALLVRHQRRVRGELNQGAN
jgi:hypothetical protein